MVVVEGREEMGLWSLLQSGFEDASQRERRAR